MNSPSLKIISEVQSFLGLASYFRKFMQKFKPMTSPLFDLLQDIKKPFGWTTSQQTAFEELKKALIEAPVLALPKMGESFEVHTDASYLAIGGVLIQEGHPIAFESHRLSEQETRSETHEQEMFAVIGCLKKWEHYLLPSEVTVINDNISNTYFTTKPKLSLK